MFVKFFYFFRLYLLLLFIEISYHIVRHVLRKCHVEHRVRAESYHYHHDKYEYAEYVDKTQCHNSCKKQRDKNSRHYHYHCKTSRITDIFFHSILIAHVHSLSHCHIERAQKCDDSACYHKHPPTCVGCAAERIFFEYHDQRTCKTCRQRSKPCKRKHIFIPISLYASKKVAYDLDLGAPKHISATVVKSGRKKSDKQTRREYCQAVSHKTYVVYLLYRNQRVVYYAEAHAYACGKVEPCHNRLLLRPCDEIHCYQRRACHHHKQVEKHKLGQIHLNRHHSLPYPALVIGHSAFG